MRPGTKLKGIPIAIIPSVTSLELALKTELRVFVEKYMTKRVSESDLASTIEGGLLTRRYSTDLLSQLSDYNYCD